MKEHPEWFLHRADGTIRHAENPPKKYEDVYPFDFECEAWESLWKELCSVVLHWFEQGVRVFRVDDPHTKSLRFWEDSLRDLIGKLNRVRRENAALHDNRISFHNTDNPQLFCFAKRDATGENVVLCIVSLDIHHTHSGWVELDLPAIGIQPGERAIRSTTC